MKLSETLHTSFLNLGGGALALLCNTLTAPLLYAILPTGEFATWAASYALLNLACFPEVSINLWSAANVASTAGKAPDELRKLAALSILIMLAGLGVQTVLTSHQNSEESAPLAPTAAILLLVIPLRLKLAELKGSLISARQWQKLNILQAGGAALTAALLIGSSCLGIGSAGLAFAYLSAISFQYSLASYIVPRTGLQNQRTEKAPNEKRPNVWDLVIFGAGPVIMSQGDRICLYHLLNPEDYGIYILSVTIGSQINTLSALGSQQLLSRNRGPLDRDHDVWTCTRTTIGIALTSGLLVLLFLPSLLPMLGKPTPPTNLLMLLVLVYAALAINSPGYFYIIGQGKWSEVSAVVLAASIFALAMTISLAYANGIYGAIYGNIGYLVAIWLNYRTSCLTSKRFLWKLSLGYALILSMLASATFVVFGQTE